MHLVRCRPVFNTSYREVWIQATCVNHSIPLIPPCATLHTCNRIRTLSSWNVRGNRSGPASGHPAVCQTFRRGDLKAWEPQRCPPLLHRRSVSSRPPPRDRPPPHPKLATRDRGPPSSEDTQTDFAALNVLGNSTNATTSIEVCSTDGFTLDNGLRIADGDGLMLVGSEAFVWRPWMESVQRQQKAAIITGNMLWYSGRGGKASEVERTGGVLNKKGQFEVDKNVWGVLDMVWPKPDLIIIGTGPTIRPLAPSTRNHLQEIGLRIEVLDTRNAAAQFNLLSTERGANDVAAAMVPIGFGQ